MLMIISVKILSDLAIYYSFFGFLATLLGAAPSYILAALAIQTAAYILSYLLAQKGRLRYLPLLLMLGTFLLTGAGIAGTVVSVLPIFYIVYTVKCSNYTPDYTLEQKVFSLFWKLFIAFFVFATLFGAGEQFASIALPCGVIAFSGLIIMLRSLRHEKEIYCDRRFQLINLIIVGALLALACLLSSKLFLGLCADAAIIVYRYTLQPIILLITLCIRWILEVLFRLIGLIGGNKTNSESSMLQIPNAEDLFETDVDTVSGVSSSFDIILKVCGIILVLTAVFFLFRYLAKRNKSTENKGIETGRSSISVIQKKSAARAEGSVQKVRAQYGKFLKLCDKLNVERKRSSTSLDIQMDSRRLIPEEESGELREIYIKARYKGEAEKTDAARAKELYSELRKITDEKRE